MNHRLNMVESNEKNADSFLFAIIFGVYGQAEARNSIRSATVVSQNNDSISIDVQYENIGHNPNMMKMRAVVTYEKKNVWDTTNLEVSVPSGKGSLRMVIRRKSPNGPSFRTDGITIQMYSNTKVLGYRVMYFDKICESNSNSWTPPTLQDQRTTEKSTNPSGLPDLIISGASWEPHTAVVRPGTKMRLSFEIENIGTSRTTRFVRVVGPGNYSRGFSGGLNVGESKIIFIEYPLYSADATYRLKFTVDRENTIKESNERNNGFNQLTFRTTF